MATSEEAATAAAEALIASGDDEAQETESGSDTDVVWPDFSIEIPAELAAELEEDDYDPTVSDSELDDLSADNEEVPREILARMRAAEKKAEHLEKLRVNEAKKNWADEAKKFFPLAEPFLDEITATSRRGYLRTAKNVHERMTPIVEQKVLAPAREAIERAKADAIAQGKADAEAAWGKPLVKGDTPSEAGVTLQATQDRRRRGELSDTIRNMIFPKES